MNDKILVYPTIFAEFHDDGDYFTVTSPNIPGMITQGQTRQDAAIEAIDAIATMLDGENYPVTQDPSQWKLANSESIVYITVNMSEWYRAKERALKTKAVRRTITLPEYLNDLAKNRGINVSRVASEALEKVLEG
ncbi:type II toxin-antitoxin system HicB family antitoxin [Lapidilactobacillus mulanensis]|uniref:Type II toxin-antitoxin system HicB family antitoxin n=1 Tax=Lapidilactobacillus mulanensis TaxID=2485999 RepID=A0ABW4DQJ9_9LACO|nr:type II toxin-antitoxin system HicB family antitoxin [Lapidilactobacillus mulanensis]